MPSRSADFKFNAVLPRPPPDGDLALRVRARLLWPYADDDRGSMVFQGVERFGRFGGVVVPVQEPEVVRWAEGWLRCHEALLLGLLVTI